MVESRELLIGLYTYRMAIGIEDKAMEKELYRLVGEQIKTKDLDKLVAYVYKRVAKIKNEYLSLKAYQQRVR